MKLYMVPGAPNPTKVMLYIAERAELGVDMGIEQVVVNTLKGRQREPEHLARNPFGTLPVMELDDGSHLVESLVIMEYLEDLFPDGRLQGDDPAARAHARDLERICDVRLGTPMAIYGHAKNSPLGWPPNPELAAELEERMQVPLDHVEGLLSDGRSLLTGDQVTIADCTLQAGLQFLRFCKVDVIGDRPNLSTWDARYRERPAAKVVLKF